MKKLLLIFFIIAAVFICLALSALFTTKGSRYVTIQTLDKYTDASEVKIDKSTGSFIQGITFENLELDRIAALPEGSKIKIQRLFINLKSFGLDGLVVKSEHARIMLPAAVPVVLAGAFENGDLNFNIFSQGFTFTRVFGYLPALKKLVPFKGEVNNVDLYLKGTYEEPKISGAFLIEQFIYKGFILSNSPGKIDIALKDIKSDIKLFGNVVIDGGKLDTPKTSVTLQPGEIKFAGSWDKPAFNFKGNSTIEKTRINISLKGALESPELTLTSEPSYSKQKLMVMLATGKSWKSVEKAMDTGLISKDLTKDFIDYFIFAGRASRFAEKFGIHDFTFKAEKNAKGFGAKKDMSDNLEVGYEMEKRTAEEQKQSVSQKLQGEYKITPSLSVEAEKETVKSVNDDILNGQPSGTKSNNKVFLKYQKSF